MRELEPASTSTLRHAFLDMVHGVNLHTKYGVELQHLIKIQHPKWDREEISLEAAKANLASGAFIWVNRFLFDAPQHEKSSLILAVHEEDGVHGDYIDRLFPVALDALGRPYLKEHPVHNWDVPDIPVKEFEYFAAHYPRRKRWW